MTANHISIPLGIIIGLLASFVQSLGLTIQRKSHVVNQSLPEHRQTVEHRRPLWLLGFAIFISSNILGSFVQIASLPVVILAPLGAVSLLWNAFFARLLLGDVFSPWMILGTIFIAGGAVLIAFFGIVPEVTRSLEDLLRLFARPAFIAYFSVLGFVVIVCLAITHITEYTLSRRISKQCHDSSSKSSPASTTIDLPTHPTNLATGISDAIADTTLPTDRTPLLDPKLRVVSPSNSSINTEPVSTQDLRSINRTRLLLAISYASFSGIISGMCLIFAKSGVELLILTFFGGENQFYRWESWVLVLGLIIFALLQLWYLHKALILANPILVCPSAFCFYNLSSIVNGLVYFDQFALIPPLHLGLVILGIVVLLCGVWVVSIQPGTGVDVGTWDEEVVNLEGEDVALYAAIEAQAQGQNGTQPNEDASEREPSSPKPTRPPIGAMPMARETLSESNISNILSSETAILDDETADPRLTQSMIAPAGHKTRASLYSDSRLPSHLLNRRPTDPLGAASSATTRSRTASHPAHTHPHIHTHGLAHTLAHAPLSPPLPGAGATLSTGFQIGLSPLSPGFTIMPLERRRRPSALGGAATFADVAADVVRGVRGRRRTVSEGELVIARARTAGRPQGHAGAAEENGEGDDGARNSDLTSSYTTEGGYGRRRWRWLKNIFSRD